MVYYWLFVHNLNYSIIFCNNSSICKTGVSGAPGAAIYFVSDKNGFVIWFIDCLYFIFQIPDASGRMPRMVLWRAPGSDVTGMICRCEKVVTTSEKVRTQSCMKSSV